MWLELEGNAKMMKLVSVQSRIKLMIYQEK